MSLPTSGPCLTMETCSKLSLCWLLLLFLSPSSLNKLTDSLVSPASVHNLKCTRLQSAVPAVSGTHRLAISAADAQILVHAYNVIRVGIVGNNVIGSATIKVEAWLMHQLDLPPLLLLHKLYP